MTCFLSSSRGVRGFYEVTSRPARTLSGPADRGQGLNWGLRPELHPQRCPLSAAPGSHPTSQAGRQRATLLSRPPERPDHDRHAPPHLLVWCGAQQDQEPGCAGHDPSHEPVPSLPAATPPNAVDWPCLRLKVYVRPTSEYWGVMGDPETLGGRETRHSPSTAPQDAQTPSPPQPQFP